MKIYLYILTALACLLPIAHADDVFRADQHFASIAHLLERADRAFENNAREEALRLYGSAKRAYEQFAESFPTFAPDLVRFRISYCRNQMSLIRQQLAEQPVGTLPPATPRPPPSIPPRVLHALQEGNLDVVREAHAQKQAAEDPAALLIQAALYVKEGNLESARMPLQTFLEQFPDHPAAHYNMAQLILRDNQPDFDKARDHYRKALRGGAPQDEDLEIVIGFE